MNDTFGIQQALKELGLKEINNGSSTVEAVLEGAILSYELGCRLNKQRYYLQEVRIENRRF